MGDGWRSGGGVVEEEVATEHRSGKGSAGWRVYKRQALVCFRGGGVADAFLGGRNRKIQENNYARVRFIAKAGGMSWGQREGI